MRKKLLISVSPLFLLALSLMFISPKSSLAFQHVIAGVPAYGYNVSPAPDGNAGIIGCGPTTGAMILGYYDLVAPGLITNPLADARLMGSATYMDVNPAGFGFPSRFQFGLEDFAYDRGYIVDAVIHVEPTTFIPANWSAYTEGPDLKKDATFWNTTTWDILDSQFLNFLAVQIDANRPVSLTVDSGGSVGDDHWLVGVGYDREANQWAGYNTWDSSIHWYDVQSAYIAGNTMGIGFVRTFNFEGPVQPPNGVPEPGTLLLLGSGLIGLVGFGRKKFLQN